MAEKTFKKKEEIMWAKIIAYFLNLGDFMFIFLKTFISCSINKIGPVVLEIVREVEAECPSGTCSGEDKFQKALAKAIEKFPGVALNAVRCAIEISVAIMNEKADDESYDGCMVDGKKDSDCDGATDDEDACPNDPDCQ